MLRFAYLDDTADPSVLIWGGASALEALAGMLQVGRGVVILIDTLGQTQIEIDIDDLGEGMSRLSESEFRWSIHRDDRERLVDMISVVASCTTPCHHYLDDPQGRGLAIKVSKGEYPDDFQP
jgi:hypothetical protein